MRRNTKFKIIILTLIIILLLFALLIDYFRKIDISINNSITPQSPVMWQIMLGVSFLGSTLFVILLIIAVAGILYRKNKKKESMFYILAVAPGMLLGRLVKQFAAKERPLNELTDGFAFPSGHTIAAVLAYGALAYLLWDKNRKLSYFLLVMPVLIGATRIYLGVHWVSDVLGAILIGSLWLVLSIWIYKYEKSGR